MWSTLVLTNDKQVYYWSMTLFYYYFFLVCSFHLYFHYSSENCPDLDWRGKAHSDHPDRGQGFPVAADKKGLSGSSPAFSLPGLPSGAELICPVVAAAVDPHPALTPAFPSFHPGLGTISSPRTFPALGARLRLLGHQPCGWGTSGLPTPSQWGTATVGQLWLLRHQPQGQKNYQVWFSCHYFKADFILFPLKTPSKTTLRVCSTHQQPPSHTSWTILCDWPYHLVLRTYSCS